MDQLTPDSSTGPTIDDDLDLALRMADLADGVAMRHFRSQSLRVATKPDATPVTEADREAESVISRTVAEERPGDGILGEEFGASGDASDRVWIIDPIDGTKNYLRGVPVWCTLIALSRAGPDGPHPVLGVVSAPALGRRWFATVGGGAFTRDINGTTRAIRVSGIDRIADASFSYSDREGWSERGAEKALADLERDCWRTRAYGDFLSHVLVAEGAVDIAAEPFLAPWDMAALIPVVTEAGGRFSGYDGSPALRHGSGVSTNSALHGEVLRRLSDGSATTVNSR